MLVYKRSEYTFSPIYTIRTILSEERFRNLPLYCPQGMLEKNLADSTDIQYISVTLTSENTVTIILMP